MKVYYLLDSLGAGGAERSLLEIVSRLREVEPVVCHLFPADELADEFRACGARLESLGVTSKLSLPRAAARLSRRLRAERPDLLQLSGFFAAFVGRLAGRWSGVPIVDTFTNECYTPAHFAATPPRSRWKLALARRLERRTLTWAARIVAVSEAVRQANCGTLGVPLERVDVIHRGRDPRRYRQPDAETLAGLRGSLGLDADGAIALLVSRLIPRKGIEDAIHAAARLAGGSDRRVTWLVAGEGHHRPSLERLAGELAVAGRFRFLGQRPDVPALLHLADIFVLCSRFEGHPGALVEAMLAGRPIIASDTPVHRETLGEAASEQLYPIGDAGALAAAVAGVLADPRRAATLGELARRSAAERFAIDRIAAAYERLYSQVLAPVAGRAQLG